MKSKILGLLALGLLAGPVAESATVITSACPAPYSGACLTAIGGLNVGGTLYDVDFKFGFDSNDAAMTYFNGNKSGAEAAAASVVAAISGLNLTGVIASGNPSVWLGAVIYYGGPGQFFPNLAIEFLVDGSIYDQERIDNNPWARFSAASVPEPGTLALLGLGLAGLGLSRRRKAN